MNEKFQNALKRVPQKVPPIWFMRQAGRYHRHYQGLRSRHSFMELCKQPELAAQVALGPVEDFGFDVSILFSDILFPLEALGMGLDYTDAGPRLGFSLLDSGSLERLRPVSEAVPFLDFQRQALIATREVLPKTTSLIGFIGGPWTLFCYATEGTHSGTALQSKRIAPEKLGHFMEVLMPLLEENIRLQLAGGAEVVMVFDTAAGLLSPGMFRQWAEPLVLRLLQRFPGRLGYYSRDTQASFFSPEFLSAPLAGLGVDHRWYLPDAFRLRKGGFVQGCFDQALLFQAKPDFERALDQWLAPIRALSPEERVGWVCGLGHGVLPGTPEGNVRRFVERVREVLA